MVFRVEQFDVFAKTLNWILVAIIFWHTVIYYLDDSLAIPAPHADIPLYEQQFDPLCKQQGFTVSHEKDIKGTVAGLLGLEIDTDNMQARLPRERLKKGEALLKALQKGTSISRFELESVGGFLSFAAKVVIPGRAFLRWLYHALGKPNKWIYITSGLRKYIKWWRIFLPTWNGVCMPRTIITREP